MARMLLSDCGADPHMKSKHGSTALHVAAMKGSEEGFRMLVDEFGVDPTVRDRYGTLAGHVAFGMFRGRKYGATEFEQYLKRGKNKSHQK